MTNSPAANSKAPKTAPIKLKGAINSTNTICAIPDILFQGDEDGDRQDKPILNYTTTGANPNDPAMVNK
jgi:hypothetical protein